MIALVHGTGGTPVLLSLSQFHSPDFAANGLWQLRKELDLTRIFVWRSDAFAMFLQLLLEPLAGEAVSTHYYNRLDDPSANRIGLAHHRGFYHHRKFDERALDLERANAVARALDHVIAPAYEPETALRIAFGAVAGQIPIAPESGSVLFRVAPILAEKSQWTPRGYPHRDLSLFAVPDFAKVVIEYSDGKTWGGFAHRARARGFVPGTDVGDEHDRLGLPIALKDHLAGRSLPGSDDLWVERLASAHAMTQARKSVGRQVFAHHEPQGRRRCAPASDGIARQRAQRRHWIKLATGVYSEHAGPHLPRPEQAGPRCLGPSGIGDAPMQISRFQVQPQLAGNAMTQAVAGLGGQHHLGRAGRAAGEIDDARIVAPSWLRVEHRIGMTQTGVEGKPPGALGADENAMGDRKPLGLGRAVLVGYQRARRGRFQPIANVARREPRCSRYWHRTQPNQPQDGNPPLRHPMRNNQHPVSAPDADLIDNAGRAADAFGKLGKRQLLLGSILLAYAPQSKSVTPLLRPPFDHVSGEIEVCPHGFSHESRYTQRTVI